MADSFILIPSPIPVPWSNVSGFCPDTLPYRAAWIVPLGQCVTNVRLYFAFFIGMASVVCWLLAQAPQLVLNCIHGKADEALSIWFLLQWFAGDSTNLVGALLTHQLTTQIVTAIYFVSIDLVMMTQYVFYQIKNHGTRGLIDCFKCRMETTATMIIFPCLLLTVALTSTHSMWRVSGFSSHPSAGATGRSLLSTENTMPVVDTSDPRDLIGYIIGCISAALYICSRMPQIMKNFIRRSTDGLSLPMFILAVMGNLTYSLGVLLVSVEPVFILRKLPWLIGSIGTLCFDFTIFLQFLMFGCCRRKTRHCCSSGKENDPESTPLLDSTVSRTSNKSTSMRQYMCACCCYHHTNIKSNGQYNTN